MCAGFDEFSVGFHGLVGRIFSKKGDAWPLYIMMMHTTQLLKGLFHQASIIEQKNMIEPSTIRIKTTTHEVPIILVCLHPYWFNIALASTRGSKDYRASV